MLAHEEEDAPAPAFFVPASAAAPGVLRVDAPAFWRTLGALSKAPQGEVRAAAAHLKGFGASGTACLPCWLSAVLCCSVQVWAEMPAEPCLSACNMTVASQHMTSCAIAGQQPATDAARSLHSWSAAAGLRCLISNHGGMPSCILPSAS